MAVFVYILTLGMCQLENRSRAILQGIEGYLSGGSDGFATVRRQTNERSICEINHQGQNPTTESWAVGQKEP